MFIISKLQDTIKILPKYLSSNLESIIISELDKKYSNKVSLFINFR